MRSPHHLTKRVTVAIFGLACLFISVTLSVPDSAPAPLKTLLSSITRTTEAAVVNGKIAFAREAGGDFQIFVMNADGTNSVQLTSSAGNFAPAFSPDRRIVALTIQATDQAQRDRHRSLQLPVLIRTAGMISRRLISRSPRATAVAMAYRLPCGSSLMRITI